MKQTIHEIYFELCKKHVKNQEKDLVLLQVGSFFEAYSSPSGDGSAELLANVLNIHLTRKSTKHEFSEKNPKMSGIPMNNLERHLNLLLDQDYKVTIYEQNPDNVKDRRYRGCFTKNIRMDFDSESSIVFKNEKKIFSLILEKFHVTRNKVKIDQYKLSYSFLEMNTAKMYFSEYIDDNAIRMVEQFLLQNTPDEMMFYINKEFSEEEKLSVKELLVQNNFHFDLQTYEPMTDYHKIERTIDECFQKPPNLTFFPESQHNLYFLIEHVRKYDPIQVENLICDDNPWILQEKENGLRFNRDLLKELFIFDSHDERSAETKKNFRSIFDILSFSMNSMAKRNLARMLNSPLTCPTEMERRYQLIENNTIPLQVFHEMIDLESYFLKWSRANLNPRMVAKLLMAYQKLQNYYPDTINIINRIDSVWNITKMMVGEEFFKEPSTEYKTWKLQYDYTLKLFYDHESKYGISFHEDVKNIADSYFNISSAKWNKYSTEIKNKYRIISSKNTTKHIMLIEMEQNLYKLQALYRKIINYQIVKFKNDSDEFLNEFREIIINLNNKIAQDAMLSVLQHFFRTNSYTRPSIQFDSETSFYQVEKVRHPLLEKLYPDEIFVPFSSELDKNRNGMIIYGLNRSGKSTYMKSIATCLYLAQCGLFAPCESLVFSPYRSIYSKLSHYDNLFKKQSLFFNEIQELKYILNRIHDNRSLLLLDELFQGTEIPSTIGLLLAIVDKFVKKGIHFMISTHIHLISSIIETKYRERIQIFHFKMNEVDLIKNKTLVTDSPAIFYNRSMEAGSGPPLYGIELANDLGIEDDIINTATTYRNHVQLDYNFKGSKESKYNKKIIKDECALCHQRHSLEVHHILQQKFFKNSTNMNGFEKNNKTNLIVLCRTCHDKIEKSMVQK